MRFIKYIIVLVLIWNNFSFAQQTKQYTSNLAEYQQAVELYDQNYYKLALDKFNSLETSQSSVIASNIAYYKASASVRLGLANSDQLMLNFVKQYPQSNKRKIAFLSVANFYFESGDYRSAKKWFSQVDQSVLNFGNKDQFYFNYAYTLFKTKNFKQAQTYFNRVRNHKTYGAQAKYYIGYMAYQDNNYEDANTLFNQAKENGLKGNNLSYFQSGMNFKLGKFQKAIDLGLEQLPKSNVLERSQLNKIIGESYFNLKEYNKAIEYLKNYKGKRGKWNNTDYYQLGFAYYKVKQYQKAINEFNKIIDGKDFVAQNAYYHLAQAYLKTDKKTQALNAFKNASEMSFNEEIKEDAFLNYAKLSYEIGNTYKPVPQVLKSFLEAYPQSESSTEIGELLINSYITSKQYKEAISMLEGSNDFSDKKAYQKVTYLYGIELFEAGEYAQAKTYFNKSLDERIDSELIAKATYWNAEIDYLFNNFKEALVGYKAFKGMPNASQIKSIYPKIDYNIGYTYFKLKDYAQAEVAFKTFTNSNSSTAEVYDAYVRLGDANFAEGDYWPAMEAYNKAIAMNQFKSDYAYFQKAYSYGFVDKNDRKIEELNKFIKQYPQSIYVDDALYFLANTYANESNSKQAISTYQQLISSYPASAYQAKAQSQLGLVYYNQGQNNKALKQLKQLVNQFPNSKEALQAVQTVRLIYIDLGQTEAYAAWVKQLDFVDVADADIDNATYESAENKFLENNVDAAIKGFKKYLDQFPKGIHTLNAHFYLAQLLYDQEEKENSKQHYQYVIESSSSEFTEESLRKLSTIYLSEDNYTEAIPLLKRLESEANFTQNVVFAQTNLMKASYQTKQYTDAIKYADLILALPNIDKAIIADAKLFTARSAIKLDQLERAKLAYQEVETIASGQLKAEALYYNAYFLNQDGKYEASNKVIQNITKNFAQYKQYSVKAFYIMAKNYYALGDAYQATYILENIIKNFGERFPNIKQDAETTLAEIKEEEAKTNASIEVNKTSTENKDDSVGENMPSTEGNN